MIILMIVACRRMRVGQSRLLDGRPDIQCGEGATVVGEGAKMGNPRQDSPTQGK